MTFLPDLVASKHGFSIQTPADGGMTDFFMMRLREMEAEILEGMKNTKEVIRRAGGFCPDVADQASKEEEASLELMAHGRNKQLLRDIRAAIDRIHHGEYGCCRDCGIEISTERLMASPTAAECFDCKSIQETKSKSYAPRYN